MSARHSLFLAISLILIGSSTTGAEETVSYEKLCKYPPGWSEGGPALSVEELGKYPVAVVKVVRIIDSGALNKRPVTLEAKVVERLYKPDHLPDTMIIAKESTGFAGCGRGAPYLYPIPKPGETALVQINDSGRPPAFGFIWRENDPFERKVMIRRIAKFKDDKRR